MTAAAARRAFTLAELVAVMVVTGILAAGAVPAMRSVERTRERALAAEVQRRLSLARSWAAATGRPAGLRIDTATGALTLVRIAADGDPPTVLPAASGAPGAAWFIARQFPGASILAVRHGDNTLGAGAIWFGADGEPQIRSANGAYLQDFTTDAQITVSGPSTITVRQITGMIER